jgi:divalent metal cation (Fe/Co/Zn/Cd) transporter
MEPDEKMMAMGQSIPIIDNATPAIRRPSKVPAIVLWLQGITLAWMLVECAVSLYAAKTAHSVALLAFGSDSLVELLSASVALMSFLPSFPLTKDHAARWAGILLFVLASLIAFTAITALIRDVQPDASYSGISITVAALVIMPLLTWLKRKVAKATGNRALAADAVQSATCAYLAAITLSGLAVNALFHIRWMDSVAAFAALPILVIEGRKAMRGESCCSC